MISDDLWLHILEFANEDLKWVFTNFALVCKYFNSIKSQVTTLEIENKVELEIISKFEFVELKNLNCQFFDETENSSKTVCEFLSHTGNLQSLDFGNSCIESVFKNIASTFIHLPRLKSLSLNNCCIGTYIEKVAPEFAHLKNLQYLDLSQIFFELEYTQALFLILGQLKFLKSLDLYECNLCLESIQLLSLHLRNWQELEELYLGANFIGPDGIKVLAPVLESLKNLRKLDLADNGFESDGTITLSNELYHLKQLKYLNLRFNAFESKEAIILFASSLEQLDQMEELYFSHCEFGSEGMQILVPSLAKLKNLKILDLCYNDVGHEGTVSFSLVLKNSLSNLKCLKLCGNIMKLETVKILVHSLSFIENLKELDLGDCGIGFYGFEMVANHLSYLVSLNLHVNCIQSKSVERMNPIYMNENPFVFLIMKFQNLKELDLLGAVFDTQDMEACEKVKEQMPCLKTFLF